MFLKCFLISIRLELHVSYISVSYIKKRVIAKSNLYQKYLTLKTLSVEDMAECQVNQNKKRPPLSSLRKKTINIRKLMMIFLKVFLNRDF